MPRNLTGLWFSQMNIATSLRVEEDYSKSLTVWPEMWTFHQEKYHTGNKPRVKGDLSTVFTHETFSLLFSVLDT